MLNLYHVRYLLVFTIIQYSFETALKLFVVLYIYVFLNITFMVLQIIMLKSMILILKVYDRLVHLRQFIILFCSVMKLQFVYFIEQKDFTGKSHRYLISVTKTGTTSHKRMLNMLNLYHERYLLVLQLSKIVAKQLRNCLLYYIYVFLNITLMVLKSTC